MTTRDAKTTTPRMTLSQVVERLTERRTGGGSSATWKLASGKFAPELNIAADDDPERVKAMVTLGNAEYARMLAAGLPEPNGGSA